MVGGRACSLCDGSKKCCKTLRKDIPRKTGVDRRIILERISEIVCLKM